MITVAALCVSGRSIYKHLPGVLAFDSRRDARTFPGGMPVVAHPPCRCWSKHLRHQAKPLDARAEMDLGRWCVEQVIENGGVLEHPAGSLLFTDMKLPVPVRQLKDTSLSLRVADPFLFTLYVEQSWFGYATPKPTWLLVAGVPRHLVELPFRLDDGRRRPNTRLSQTARARTVTGFAEWLCCIARLSWWAIPGVSGQRRGSEKRLISNPSASN